MKKIIIPIVLIVLISLTIFVAAQVIDEDRITVSIELEEGWNLASNGMFAVYPLDTSDIKINNIVAIFYYNPKLKQYRQLHPNREAGTNELYDISENYVPAAWIYSKRKGTLTFETDDIVKVSERKLKAGWNFLSITPTFMGNSLNDLKGTCDIQRAYVWWNEKQEWKNVSDGLNEEFYEGAASGRLGEGIVVKVSENCRLGSTVAPIPPSLP